MVDWNSVQYRPLSSHTVVDHFVGGNKTIRMPKGLTEGRMVR